MKRTSACKRQRGSQLVELAIIIPVLFLLVMGMIDLSALYRTHQILNNAVREGARLSIQPENRQSPLGSDKITAIQQAVVDYFNDQRDLDSTQAPLTVTNVTVDQNQYVATPSGIYMSCSRVTVNYRYTLQYLPHLSGIPDGLQLSAVAEFRNLY